MTPRKLYKFFAFSEAVTWTLLLGGLSVRAIWGAPQLTLTVIGGIHGAVFLGYAVVSALVGVNQRWGFPRTVAAVALAIVPYATIPFEVNVERKSKLVGNWRTGISADPRDYYWFDRVFRWFINRPVLLASALLLVVVAIFVALIIIGPPGGWPKDE